MPRSDSDGPCPELGTYRCGDQDPLDVMERFKKFYEDKLKEAEEKGCGDGLELKLKIQKRWIEDLTEQTEMMARIVKELEDEATLRVKALEDKLRQTSKAAYEVMKRYQNYSISHNLDEPFQKSFYLESDIKSLLEFIRRARDEEKWSMDGLQFYDITYNDLFGKERLIQSDDKETSVPGLPNGDLKKGMGKAEDISVEHPKEELYNNNQSFAIQLKQKTEQYEELKKSMLDMRSALTEEVACKHDMISALKKDIQQLEERCIQSDKQTAFKDDIIKELRKEIKQLKQQNKDKEKELQRKLDDALRNIQRMRPCVDVKTAATFADDPVNKNTKLIQNKDDIIQIQNDTLNVVEFELQAAKKREKDLEDEICQLRCKCDDLEKTLASSNDRSENLQRAVDLYVNSINVLETSEEKARLEIEQQKMTIVNLQEALVNVKHELDEFRSTNQEEVSWAARWFGGSQTNQKSVHDV